LWKGLQTCETYAEWTFVNIYIKGDGECFFEKCLDDDDEERPSQLTALISASFMTLSVTAMTRMILTRVFVMKPYLENKNME
jgi:hypothetical protein